MSRRPGLGHFRATACGVIAIALNLTQPRSASGLADQTDSPQNPSHIRPLHPLVSRLLREGLAGSPTLKHLVGDLATLNVTVYVDVSLAPKDGPRGSLRLMTAGANHRFLRIQIETGTTPWPTDLRRLIVILGHELRARR